MFCSFCIVPQTRGREISRPAADILDEAAALAERGVREITLLGQTVNAYGRHEKQRDRRAEAGTLAFAELLARLDAIPGLERIRYTSPHPIFFDEALIRAHAELPSLCPHVHLPVQSGSDRVLQAMRRRYRRDEFLAIAETLRRGRPDLVITTDLIVAFPGESESDFLETLELVERVGFEDSYCFKYSPRPGTKAVDLEGKIPEEEAQRRLLELQRVQRQQTLAYHRSRVGSRTAILVEGASRRGPAQVSGRDPYHRVVNLALEPGLAPQPGELLPVKVVEATPHSLIGAGLGAENPARRLKEEPRSADEGSRSAALPVTEAGSG
jgi:tRNA-2-methylthio-N6-dimethylallyladenosine synthase